jgi:hypothetical protein
MSRAAFSVWVFGLYLAGQGALLLVSPDFLLGLLGLPLSQDVWPRAVGVALLALAFYYVQSARAESRPFFGWTVQFRGFQFVVFVVLVALGLGEPILLLTSGVELLAGVWTWLELRTMQA